MRAVLCSRQISDKMRFSPRNAGYRKYSANEFHEYSHSRPNFKAKSPTTAFHEMICLIGTYLFRIFARSCLNPFYLIIFYLICF